MDESTLGGERQVLGNVVSPGRPVEAHAIVEAHAMFHVQRQLHESPVSGTLPREDCVKDRVKLVMIFLAGCVAYPVMRTAMEVPPARADTVALPGWEYHCLSGPDHGQLNQAGAAGWELATAFGPTSVFGGVPAAPVYCFKRPKQPSARNSTLTDEDPRKR